MRGDFRHIVRRIPVSDPPVSIAGLERKIAALVGIVGRDAISPQVRLGEYVVQFQRIATVLILLGQKLARSPVPGPASVGQYVQQGIKPPR